MGKGNVIAGYSLVGLERSLIPNPDINPLNEVELQHLQPQWHKCKLVDM
jgi:hypothetical protein